MKQQIKYQIATIPRKLLIEMRMIIDSNDKYKPGLKINIAEGGDEYLELKLFPVVNLNIFREILVVEGIPQRRDFNPNDNVMLTKYNLPLFLDNLNTIIKDFQTPKLYHYTDGRLELDSKLAESIQKKFIISQKLIIFTPVVINNTANDGNESQLEGIEMKINTDESTVLLTLNDMSSLSYILNKLDIDSLSIQLYTNFIKK